MEVDERRRWAVNNFKVEGHQGGQDGLVKDNIAKTWLI